MTEQKSTHARWGLNRTMIVFSFAGVFAFLYLRTFLLPAIPFVAIDDQVLFFARAVRIVHGQVLYRDFFELVTPGTDLLYAGAFRLFGIHAWIIGAWSICVGLALFSITTLIASRIFRGPLVLLPGLLFVVLDFNSGLNMTHHWYSTLAAMAAVGVLTGGISLQRIFVAGLLCGVAALFTQTQGALTFAALAAYLLWRRPSKSQQGSVLRQFTVLLLPFVFVLSCVLGYYTYKAGPRVVFFDLVVFPPKFMSTIEINQPRTYLDQIGGYASQFARTHKLTDLLSLIPVVFIYATVPYIYFLGLYQLRRKREVLPSTIREGLVLLHLVGLALFMAVINGPRYFRLCTVAPPAILICVWLVSHQSRAQRFTRNLLWLVMALFALLLPMRRQTQWHATLNLPIGRTAFNDAATFHEFQWLAQRTRPSDFFFNNSAVSLYLGLDNPTASEFVTYDEFSRPDQIAAIVRALRNHPPNFIVLLPKTMISSEVHDHASGFRQFVYDNYSLAQILYADHSLYEQEIWERKSNPIIGPSKPGY
jgi:hypothetical protein